jgi:natural product biosynthesis luciferase-like monooxygenase protein
MKTPLSCLIIGDESLLVPCAETLRARGHDVAAFVTQDETIRKWAAFAGIAVHAPGADLAERLTALRYDWIFGISNLHPLPDRVRARASAGAALFHDGPLPKHAGFNGPSWAILAGERTYGVTWHAPGPNGDDTGDIYVQQRFDILEDDTAFTLNSRCYEAGIESFGELLRAIEERDLTPRRQDRAARTQHARDERPAAAATLRFDRPAAEIANLVRALDHGSGYANPLALPRLAAGNEVFGVTSVEILDERATADPGTVIAVGADSAVVATADRPLKLRRIVRAGGTEVAAPEALRAGAKLAAPSDAQAARLSALAAELAPHEDFFAARLRALRPALLPEVEAAGGGEPRVHSLAFRVPAGLSSVAAVAAYLARASGQDSFDIAYADDALEALCAEFPGYLARELPLHVEAGGTLAELTAHLDRQQTELTRRRGYFADLVARRPGLARPELPTGLFVARKPDGRHALARCAATFVVAARGDEALLVYDEARIATRAAEALVRRMTAAFAAMREDPRRPIAELSLLSAQEREQVLYEWNRSDAEYDRGACVHQLFERQVDATPDAAALAFEDRVLTYRELDERANRVAHVLRAAGVVPDAPVGLYLRRSLDLVIGMLGIHKAGGAYVPLDPAYPASRLALMIEDSGARVVLTQRALLDELPAKPEKVLCVEDDAVSGAPAARPRTGVAPQNLAYVIYTSGSTGRPKGVMVEHRNVVNFFAGMDARVPRVPATQPVWLAVTSLSFDISVLELYWTLARGFKVVISSDEDRALAAGSAASGRPMDFGLFYWGNDDAPGPRKYRLLIEGAKFADARGFHSVWTPERHFHAFGGPYPNPAVTGAAVASVTSKVQIRAGSCVLPLHHPARVAEDWAVVDNLSDGRVGISFASGWMPEDFVLRPENAPPHNNAAMLRDIDIVRRLWRGEAVPFETPSGARLPVVTQPRPVQKELPFWVTTAGNPATYQNAAKLGANVLTHLLGQSIAEVAEKIRIYRAALAEHGRNPADHRVTLMLHTLVGADREKVRALACQPMKDYLRSATALIKNYAWSFPAFKKPAGVAKPMDIDLQALPAEEMDAILEFAFLRYFEDSGLFGTVDEAVARVEQLKAIGVDEIACLIDFGVETDVALSSLEALAEVVARTSRPAAGANDYSIAAQIARHGATHLQCTPSMARMLALNDDSRAALSRLRHFFIGGEALPGTLVEELRRISPAASVENMYGPTETTIWSSTQAAEPCAGAVPLGRPIANTQFYVLDERQRPVPPGTAAELYIGGDGVARGYLNRADLTRERFLPDPFREGGRMYRTGDLARYGEDGVLHFLGRVDHQVKVRGYRIELGEIEARLAAHPAVREAVVVAREDAPGDVRLVAYVRPAGEAAPDEALRAHLKESLPDYMVPAHFVAMQTFPLTPNAKVDRKALPRPDEARAPAANYVAPESDVQRQIAEVFKRVLGVSRIGIADNFFELGGHSLLAVQAHRELRSSIAPKLTITDVFRFPTVAGLAAHLDAGGKAGAQLERVVDRAAARREALAQRRDARRAREQK